MSRTFAWGHININVSNLEKSLVFYQKLGFELFLPGIPYLNLEQGDASAVDPSSAEALGLPGGVSGRACIIQLDNGFPKIDLTELAGLAERPPLQNKDLGVVRLCLVSEDLEADYRRLVAEGVSFLSPPRTCHQRMAEIATCVDPDGTLIELLQVHLERWPAIPGVHA